MAKGTYIKFRCSERFKDMVEFQAKEHQRTVSSYIEYLIRKDVDTMKIVNNGYFGEEITKELENEMSCYLSSDGENWLFTNNDVFDRISDKYRFDEELEERGWERITYLNVEDFIKFKYEECSIKFLGFNIDLTDYAETTAFTIDGIPGELCVDGWDKVLDCILKANVMTGIKLEIVDDIVNMIRDGYDMYEIKDAIEVAEAQVKNEGSQTSK